VTLDALEPQALKQLFVAISFRVVSSEQTVAVENRVGAGHEAQSLQFVVHLLTAGRQPYARLRHRDAGSSDAADEFKRIEVVSTGQRRAGNRYEIVNRNRLRWGRHVGELGNPRGTSATAFAHSHNTATTHMDASFAHFVKRGKTI